MIPGGFAGYRYLAFLGHRPKDVDERDDIIERLAQSPETINGRLNPLNAARWASDQDYINAVICGHSNRLTLDEVRIIRSYESFGKNPAEIADVLARKLTTVAAVISGHHYGRVR